MRSLPTTFMQKKRHNIWILLMSLALFLLAAVLSLLLGSAAFSPAELWKAAAGGADAAVLRIFLHVRLPRTLACILAGSALAVSGVIIQSVLANPPGGAEYHWGQRGGGIFCGAVRGVSAPLAGRCAHCRLFGRAGGDAVGIRHRPGYPRLPHCAGAVRRGGEQRFKRRD